MFRALILVIAAAVMMSCTVDSGSAVGATSEPIVDGVVERGTPAVVFLYNITGSACTATIIAPRVVLTAKHCIQGRGNYPGDPSQFRIYVGSSTRAITAEYLVEEVRPAPGCWNLCGDASDVAVLILTAPVAETPIEVSFESAISLTGREITAIGYGQTPSGTSGTKLMTHKRVTTVGDGLIIVEPTVCSGDSGGPIIGADGLIYGVASFIFSPDRRSSPTCGTAPGAYNGIANQRTLIETALEDSGTCVRDGREVCDGDDNDCDGEVDEDCTPLGEACTASDECVGNHCAETPIGLICTRDCNPLSPELGCGPGFYCANVGGCDGLCVPLPGPGTLGNEQDCTADIDCASLFCTDPGDGHRRCLAPCEGDAGTCLAGEACATLPGACGGCVAAGIWGEMRGIGEPCSDATVCRSERCFEDEGISYCSRDCDVDGDCPAGFHCRGGDACVRGPRGDVGSLCVTNDDCAEGTLCAALGDVRWCTTFCMFDADCPDGFECLDAGGSSVCAPTLGLVGSECEGPSDCISGLCPESGAGRTCARFCGPDTPCESGLECVRTADGVTAVCVPPARPSPPPTDGGCSVSRPSARGAAGSMAALAGLVALLFLAARRR